MVVNQKELAQCLGISTRQIRNLRQEGMFQTVKGDRGYVLETCVQEYINFKINAEMGRSASLSIERIKADHEEVKKNIFRFANLWEQQVLQALLMLLHGLQESYLI